MPSIPSVTDLMIDRFDSDRMSLPNSLPNVQVRDLELNLSTDVMAGFGDTDRADDFVFQTSEPTPAQDGADINIGVGELQECTISKSMDASTDVFVFEDSASGATGSDVDGRDFLLWRKNDGTATGIEDIDLSLSAVDVGPIPVSQPEYAVMIEFI